MRKMKYQVKVFDAAGRPGAKRLLREFAIVASNLEKVRRIVKKKIEASGCDIRSFSFSPDPAPYGSVVVYASAARKVSPVARSMKTGRQL